MNTSQVTEAAEILPRFRSDVLLNVLATKFQLFDKGKEITQPVPIEWQLRAGDRLRWECGSNIDGIAKVTGVNGEWCSFLKM